MRDRDESLVVVAKLHVEVNAAKQYNNNDQ